jgi:DNA-binding winged helix-turn-helix (wHTH) protein
MRVRFSDFILDLDKRELSSNGERRHLSTKAFLLLEYLVQNAPRALAKEEMYRHIWGDTFVEEVNLPNLISEIRAALGESRKAPHLIKTVHGFGYAFAGEPSVERSTRSRSRSVATFALRWGREDHPLRSGANIIGRDESADVVIDSSSVSRQHARVVIARGTAVLEDLDSKNGTFVSGQRVSTAVPLHEGDEIRVGRVSLTFRAAVRTQTTVTEMTR